MAKEDIGQRQYSLLRFLITAVCFVLVAIILSIAGCQIKDQPYADKEKQRLHDRKIEDNRRHSEANQTIKDMVEKGINPVQARCAVLGWGDDLNHNGKLEICKRFAPDQKDVVAGKVEALQNLLADIQNDVNTTEASTRTIVDEAVTKMKTHADEASKHAAKTAIADAEKRFGGVTDGQVEIHQVDAVTTQTPQVVHEVSAPPNAE